MKKKASPAKAVAKKTKPAKKIAPFDPQVFLATIKPGRTTGTYRKDEIVFSQGGTADAVFYVQKGKIKIVVASKQGKEAVVGIFGSGEFFRRGLSDRSTVTLGDGQGDGRERSHAGR